MITIYPANATDFAHNGYTQLSPISCLVGETLNGEYELTMVHPIDERGKWQYLVGGNIIRAPVPMALTPNVKIEEQTTAYSTATRGAWRITSSCEMRYVVSGGVGKYMGRVLSVGTKIAVSGSTGGYYLCTDPSGVQGYIPTGCASNLYYSTSYTQTAAEIYEGKQLRDQPFRIYRVIPELDKVTVYARHIFYDLADELIKGYTSAANAKCSDIVKGLQSATVGSHDFSFKSDITTAYSEKFSVQNVNPVEALLGEEGVQAKYGGELCRDWFDVLLVERVGADSGVLIAEGKNLLGIKYDIDYSQMATRLIPYAEKGSSYVYLPETYVDSPNIGSYDRIYTLPLDTGIDASKLNTSQIQSQLRAAANAEFAKGVDAPIVTLTVDFVNMADTDEYRDYGLLQNIYLGDTVRVKSKRLGIYVQLRLTHYQYDCLTKKYTNMELGSIAGGMESTTITGRQLAAGSVTSGKLALGAVGGMNLKEAIIGSAHIEAAAIEIAHIAQACIDQLAANSITAYRADIEKIAAGEITADNIVAAMATIQAMRVENFTAASIETDRLAGALAAFTVLTAGTATFDKATVKHLIAEALNVQDAVGDKVFIANLVTDYASMVSANVGNLCIKAADGNYYRLDVNSQGQVTATIQSVTEAEADAGVTGNGKTIIESQIAASDLNATNIKGVYALINRIDAARLDVGTLTARNAFINTLRTTDITSNTYIRLALDSLRDGIDDVDAWTTGLKRWLTFDENGLTQGKEGSIYSTVTDQTGFHIRREGTAGYVGSFAREGLKTDGITLGDIIATRTSTGGWVWKEVEQ